MAKNICPNCSYVTLNIGQEEQIVCQLCETIFNINNEVTVIKKS